VCLDRCGVVGYSVWGDRFVFFRVLCVCLDRCGFVGYCLCGDRSVNSDYCL